MTAAGGIIGVIAGAATTDIYAHTRDVIIQPRPGRSRYRRRPGQASAHHPRRTPVTNAARLSPTQPILAI